MAEHSKIEWTDATWNPVRGCEKISPACKFCYAETLAKRNPKVLGTWGPDGVRVVGSEDHWKLPIRWAKKHLRAVERGEVEPRPFRIFTASLGDVFEDHPVVERVRDRIWRETLPALEALRLPDGRPAAVLLLLTKRPEVMARWASERGWSDVFWAGCTVEDQKRADERIPHLLRVPAPVRFLSCEPLLGPVDLGEWIERIDHCAACGVESPAHVEDVCPSCLKRNHTISTWGHAQAERYRTGERYDDESALGRADLDGFTDIHWLIIGGESGPHARPMHPNWARSLIRQGVEAGIAVHFKQHGEHVPLDGEAWEIPAGWDDVALDDRSFTAHGMRFARVGKKAAGRMLDGREWNEVPNASL